MFAKRKFINETFKLAKFFLKQKGWKLKSNDFYLAT
jgi:hypothetical protein